MQKAVEVEVLSSVKRKITVNVPVEDVVKALKDSYTKVQKDAKLKGFRQGKVPRHLIDKHYRGELEAEAMEQLVQTSFPNAVKETNLSPLSRPQVTPGSFSQDAPFVYSAVVEIKPELEIKKYSGFKLEREDYKVEQKEIDAQLEQMQMSMTTLEPIEDKDAIVEEGMVVRVDYEGTIKDKVFEGGKAQDFVLDVGGGNLIPEFEVALKGMKVGETRDVKLSYPEDYFNINLAGEDAIFKVTLKEIKKKNVPALDDELAKSLGAYETIKELKDVIAKRLEDGYANKAKQELGEQAIKQLLAEHEFEIPETMVGWELHSMYQQMEQQAKSEGKDLAQMGLNPESFVQEYEPIARERVRTMLILDAIAESEKIEVTEQEVEDRLKLLAETWGEALPKVRQYYEKNKLISALNEELLREKTLDFVVEKSKINVKKSKKGD